MAPPDAWLVWVTAALAAGCAALPTPTEVALGPPTKGFIPVCGVRTDAGSVYLEVAVVPDCTVPAGEGELTLVKLDHGQEFRLLGPAPTRTPCFERKRCAHTLGPISAADHGAILYGRFSCRCAGSAVPREFSGLCFWP